MNFTQCNIKLNYREVCFIKNLIFNFPFRLRWRICVAKQYELFLDNKLTLLWNGFLFDLMKYEHCNISIFFHECIWSSIATIKAIRKPPAFHKVFMYWTWYIGLLEIRAHFGSSCIKIIELDTHTANALNECNTRLEECSNDRKKNANDIANFETFYKLKSSESGRRQIHDAIRIISAMLFQQNRRTNNEWIQSHNSNRL